jgi:hypothetical protein
MLKSEGEEQRQRHPWMDKYVVRRSIWDWHDGSRIDIVDIHGHVSTTLDPVQTWIFHEADGGRTVSNLLAWSAAHYRDGQTKPPDLDATNLKSLGTLVEDLHVVTLSDEIPAVADYLLSPWSEQDQEESLRMMKEDGYSQ